MNEGKIASFCALVAFCVSSANAENWPPFSADRLGSLQYRQCLKIDPSNVQQTNCLAKEYSRRNKQLMTLFQSEIVETEPRERAQLIKAQNAWSQFRTENCRVRRLNPGSGMGIFFYGCLVRETNTRIAEITQKWDY